MSTRRQILSKLRIAKQLGLRLPVMLTREETAAVLEITPNEVATDETNALSRIFIELTTYWEQLHEA